MEKKFKRTLVTSALPYANGPVHIGHLAGVYVPADIYVVNTCAVTGEAERQCRQTVRKLAKENPNAKIVVTSSHKYKYQRNNNQEGFWNNNYYVRALKDSGIKVFSSEVEIKDRPYGGKFDKYLKK